ncbi:MAG: HD superfamily phosphohydrolase [Saprospiraceae bacterium]|jgi:HD superfamily phosphohydrolase
MGATHLCDLLLLNLKLKGIEISEEEHKSCLVATLLHDIGHGPFSHALEYELLPIHHEEITLRIMHRLNMVFDGKLDLAILIFSNQYKRKFFHQVLSSQLDVDRMDYLNRDSYYTGVAEGIIGYERIIKMMTVVDDRLIVEEKGLHSVEKFIISRHLMYHQVYLHKASISAEQMLKAFIQNFTSADSSKYIGEPLSVLLSGAEQDSEIGLDHFLLLDDSDILHLIKSSNHENPALKFLSNGLINRHLLKTEVSDKPFSPEYINAIVEQNFENLLWPKELIRKVVISGNELNTLYNQSQEICFLRKQNNTIVTFSELTRLKYRYDSQKHYHLSYPK